MKASIIIPSKDKLSRLSVVLKCLISQLTPEVEIIVVLDGCEPDMVRTYQSRFSIRGIKTIVLPTNVGRAEARNLGIEQAKGEVIVFLDDDMVVEHDFLWRHLAPHQGNQLVLGQMLDIKLTEQDIFQLYQAESPDAITTSLAKKKYFDVGKKGNILYPLLRPFQLHWSRVYSCNMSISKRQLIDLGGFDCDFEGWGWEDSEFGYRCVKAEIDVINDRKLLAYHLHHGHNQTKLKLDAHRNYRIFAGKAGRDYPARTYAWFCDKVQQMTL